MKSNKLTSKRSFRCPLTSLDTKDRKRLNNSTRSKPGSDIRYENMNKSPKNLLHYSTDWNMAVIDKPDVTYWNKKTFGKFIPVSNTFSTSSFCSWAPETKKWSQKRPVLFNFLYYGQIQHTPCTKHKRCLFEAITAYSSLITRAWKLLFFMLF